ncbi:MAG: hypothetical protein FWE57_07035 [Chitinispirillia bacterium]|nr:hypothetical protein [Chitinispirillia bacterium]
MIPLISVLSALLILSCTGINDNNDYRYHHNISASSPIGAASYVNCRKPFLDLVNSIPDYYQRSTRFGGFPNDGSAYCGPVAASNALMWLYKGDYGKIIEKTGNAVKDQYELIKLLGSDKYFNTANDGTNPIELSLGLKKFFDNRGIKNVSIEYHGWRSMDSQFKRGDDVPNLDLIKEQLRSHRAAVLLNYGWYKYDAQKNEYTRSGGHWVNLVGFGHDGNKENPHALIINDPDMRVQAANYIVTRRIESGTLKGNLAGLPREAAGFHRFKSSSKGVGIIDGAVIIIAK